MQVGEHFSLSSFASHCPEDDPGLQKLSGVLGHTLCSDKVRHIGGGQSLRSGCFF